MFIKPAKRKYVKNCLLVASTFLGVIFVGLFIFGLCIVRPSIIAQATNSAQYYLLDLDHLPQSLDTVEPDYVGQENNSLPKEYTSKIVDEIKLNVTGSPENDVPKIAILISNLGLSKRINDLALKLPAQIALGVIPYSNSLQNFLDEAQNKGHEVYISLPNFVLDDGENHQPEDTRKFNDWFNIYGKYKGIYSSRLLANDDSQSLQHLLKLIEDKNLLFIQSTTINLDDYKKLPARKNVIYSQIIIGAEADENEIKKNLEQLVKQAKENKRALGYANGYLLTIEMINKWLPSLKSQGIELVPVSLIQDR